MPRMSETRLRTHLVILQQLESAAPDRSKAVLPGDSPNETCDVTP